MANELNYGLEADSLPVGSVTDARITHTIAGVAQADIAPGIAVGWNDAAISTDVTVKGVTRFSSSIEQDDAGLVVYKSGRAMDVVSFGPIEVETDSAVAAGAPAYVTLATGKFTATQSVATTTDACGYFETATSGAGQATLFVQRGV